MADLLQSPGHQLHHVVGTSGSGWKTLITVENREKMDKSVGDASTKTAETTSTKITYAKAVQMQNTSVINDRRRGNSEEH